jgi:hypothetical protein
MSKLQSTIIGGIIGLFVVGATVLLIYLNYKPDRGSMLDISPSKAFFDDPYLWTVFGIPFGAIIGITVHIILDYWSINWRLANATLGGISGFAVTIGLIAIVFLIFIGTSISSVFGLRNSITSFIWGGSLYIWIGLLNLLIPGALIGAIVGLLLRNN